MNYFMGYEIRILRGARRTALENLGRIMTFKAMKGLSAFLGLLTAAGTAGAQAADFGKIGYAAVEMPAEWAGFYVGTGLSGALGTPQVSSGASGAKLKLADDGAAGGVLTLGYNWQFGSWVVGAEGNVTYSELKHTGSNAVLGSVTASEQDFGSVQLRGGYSLGNVLVYGTAGAEFSQYKVSGSLVPAAREATDIGLLLGAGVDYAIDRQWLLRSEAKFFAAGDKGVDFTGGNRDVTEGVGVLKLEVLRKF